MYHSSLNTIIFDLVIITLNDENESLTKFKQKCKIQTIILSSIYCSLHFYKIKCDFDTYKDLQHSDREIVYYFDWETEQNEAKRDIKTVKASYASMIMSEHLTKLL